MKLMKRSGLYKASNVSFDPKAIMALSYDWWVFVRVIDRQVVFNDYGYSNSTRKHQRKVYDVMKSLGIKIDTEVSFKTSLCKIGSIKELIDAQAHQDRVNAEQAEAKRQQYNRRARERRARLRAQKDAEFKANLDSITMADVIQFRSRKAGV